MSSPKTLLSATTSYLSPGEFLKRVDVNTVGDLCSDTKVRITPTALLTDPNLQAALDDAAGDVESAVQMGGKYTPADLAVLIATASVGRAKLYRIITAIAKVYLVERRPGANVPEEFLAGADRAQAAIKALAQGIEIFSFKEAADAGRIDTKPATPQDVTDRFGPVVQASRYFGVRSDRAQSPSGW